MKTILMIIIIGAIVFLLLILFLFFYICFKIEDIEEKQFNCSDNDIDEEE